MEIIIVNNPEEVGRQTAELIISEINRKPDLVLGLATGDTPLETYARLVEANRTGMVDFSEVITFNLDEYVGLEKTDPNSYYHYMHSNLFDKINIKEKNTHLLDGFSQDYGQTTAKYDKLIYEHNGIDLQLLGIGMNGHIGFNEPGTELVVNTHVTNLSETTLRQNSKFFGNVDAMPKQAITMGMGTIMKAKRILLLATGKRKAGIIARLLNNNIISTDTPASALLLHPNLTVIIDEDAAEIYMKEKRISKNENIDQKHKNIVRRFSTI